MQPYFLYTMFWPDAIRNNSALFKSAWISWIENRGWVFRLIVVCKIAEGIVFGTNCCKFEELGQIVEKSVDDDWNDEVTRGVMVSDVINNLNPNLLYT